MKHKSGADKGRRNLKLMGIKISRSSLISAFILLYLAIIPSNNAYDNDRELEDIYGYYRLNRSGRKIYTVCKNTRFTRTEDCGSRYRSNVSGRTKYHDDIDKEPDYRNYNNHRQYGRGVSSRYPSYYGDPYPIFPGRAIRRIGTYETRGYLKDSLYYDYSSTNYRNRYNNYNGYGGDRTRNLQQCPYRNYDLRLNAVYRKKREANDEDKKIKFVDDEVKDEEISSRLRSKSAVGLSANNRLFFDGSGGGFFGDYGGGGFRYGRCRNDCSWEAELVCDIRTFGDEVRWTRVYDNYYPIGRYHDIMDYFGTRARIDSVEDGRSRLIIYSVFPEDKGTYVCEAMDRRNNNFIGGDDGVIISVGRYNPYYKDYNRKSPREIMEIGFYPAFPTDNRFC